MFAGHFGPALAAKAWAPEVPLWRLFLAAQAVDLLFDALVLAGVEELRIHPGTGPLAAELVWMPFSHSLVAGALYAAVCAGVGGWLRRPREGLALGAVVASHWVLDVVAHVPDVPVGWGEPRWGLGLWRWPGIGLGVELLLLGGGAMLTAAAAPWLRAGVVRLVAALCAAQLVFLLGPAPSDPRVVVGLAAVGQLAFVAAAYASEQRVPAPAPADAGPPPVEARSGEVD